MKNKVEWQAVTRNQITGLLEVNEALAFHRFNTDEGFMVRFRDGTIAFKTFDESFLSRNTAHEGRTIKLRRDLSQPS